ncbi:MAG: hypothetical protein SFY70_03335 [Bacteroidia bacterium]|nr:hypothetical protein [Bacteroidia bacterium]
MGSRTHRHHVVAGVPAQLPAVGTAVEVVRTDGTTLAGTVTAVSATEITVRSLAARWYNRSSHTHTLRWAEASEWTQLAFTAY